MAERKPPAVSPSLLKYLQEVFPNRCPNLADTDREIWAAVGIQHVIKHLGNLAKRQTNNVEIDTL